jgi:hypothetical protein
VKIVKVKTMKPITNILCPAGARPLYSEYSIPPHVRDDDHYTYQYNQDFVPAPVADSQGRAVAFLIIGRRTHLAGF